MGEELEELVAKKDEQTHSQELKMQEHQCEPLQRESRKLLEEFVGVKDPTNPVYEPFELLTAHDCPRGLLVHGGVEVRSRQYSYIDLLSHSELESLTFCMQAFACDPDDMKQGHADREPHTDPRPTCACICRCMQRAHAH